MDYKAILEILRFVSKTDLTEVEIQEGEFKLAVRRQGGTVYVPAMVPPADAAAVQLPAYTTAAVQPASQPTLAIPADNPLKAGTGTAAPAATPAAPAVAAETQRAPMIGTFYRSSGPGKDAFVKPGDVVRKGQVLCIIEAMKLFNEIESEYDGRIAKILVEDAVPVEYDQPLFLIEPVH